MSSISRYQVELSTLLNDFEDELKKRAQHVYEKEVTVKPEAKSSKQPQKLSFRFSGDVALLREVYRKCEASGDCFINPETDEDDFVEVLTAKDLSACTKEIHIGCETKQAVYILDRLKRYFGKLNPSTIGKSGLFRTKEGKVLTDDNIFYTRNTNKKKPPRDYKLIDRFFDDLDNLTKK